MDIDSLQSNAKQALARLAHLARLSRVIELARWSAAASVLFATFVKSLVTFALEYISLSA